MFEHDIGTVTTMITTLPDGSVKSHDVVVKITETFYSTDPAHTGTVTTRPSGPFIEIDHPDDRWPREIESIDDTPRDLIAACLPDVLVKGGDYSAETTAGAAEVIAAGGKFVAIPFPAMRAALNSGQVDAICAPEPFMTQGLTLDGDRILLAPGPTLGKYWPQKRRSC